MVYAFYFSKTTLLKVDVVRKACVYKPVIKCVIFQIVLVHTMETPSWSVQVLTKIQFEATFEVFKYIFMNFGCNYVILIRMLQQVNFSQFIP